MPFDPTPPPALGSIALGAQRRFYWLAIPYNVDLEQDLIASALLSDLNQRPGTPLPYNLEPQTRLKLVSAHLTALEDVRAAVKSPLSDDLEQIAGLTSRQALAAREISALALEARYGPVVTALPVGFPDLAALILAGYTTYETLAGHNVYQIALIPGVTQAQAILDAFTTWAG